MFISFLQCITWLDYIYRAIQQNKQNQSEKTGSSYEGVFAWGNNSFSFVKVVC